MKLDAWEVLDGGRGGWELVGQSEEAREHHRDGTGVEVSRVCVSGCVERCGWSTVDTTYLPMKLYRTTTKTTLKYLSLALFVLTLELVLITSSLSYPLYELLYEPS